MPVYIIDKKPGQPAWPQLIMADSRAQAMRHLAQTIFHVRPARAEEALELMVLQHGVKVERAIPKQLELDKP